MEHTWIICDILKVLGPWVKPGVLKLSEQEKSILNFTKISVSPGSPLPKPQGIALHPSTPIIPLALTYGFQAWVATACHCQTPGMAEPWSYRSHPAWVGPAGMMRSRTRLYHFSMHLGTSMGTPVLKEEPLGAFRVPADLRQARDTQWFWCYQLAFTKRTDQIQKARWKQIHIFMHFPQARDLQCRAASHSVMSFWPSAYGTIQFQFSLYI